VRPRIRYCATPASRVAYSTAGAGPALLCDSGWITDLRGQLELFSFGSFVERLAERFTVIRYDKPGCGLSDRDGIDLSFDGQVAAALAVADAVGASRFRLFGASQGGGKVRPEVVWAALDCPSGIAAAEAAGLARDTAILLGRMTASLAVLPVASDQCLVIAWPGGRDGRKLLAGSALLGPGGEVLAAARAVWLTVPRPVPALAAEGVS
jgi:pimeloyl-ACP methyl ester carboxylesterase